MGRVIAYVRVSTDKQDLENQRHEIERYCSARGLAIEEWDEDIASGTLQLKDRKVGALIDRLRSGDTLIVSEISRISRSVRTLLNVLEDCIDRGIVVVSVKQDVTFAKGLSSKIMMIGLGLAAEVEREMISARTREALARKKAEGVRLGRPPGSHKPENRKLHGKDDEILRYMRKRVPKTAIARLLDCSVSTLRRYITDQDLDTKLLVERFRKTDV
ncbi:recombinase family protein [Dietzia maris]|nr:recombinase family protein [Dietzia maris]MBB0995724.1 recombinase family protein [Dietzia maris]